jgi:hypothetical protein
MFIFYKNKGLLILLYVIVSLIGTALIVGFLHRNVGGFFSNIDFYTTLGIAFLIAGIWTYLTRYDYYKDRNGNKKKMDTVHELFFIKMKYWAYLFFVLSVVFIANIIFNYFDPVAI